MPYFSGFIGLKPEKFFSFKESCFFLPQNALFSFSELYLSLSYLERRNIVSDQESKNVFVHDQSPQEFLMPLIFS